MNISFGSTYRIPITQPGVNNSKKERLRDLTEEYNGLISSSKTGAARVSIWDREDAEFEKRLKSIGYRQFQKFEGENIPNSQLDAYIKKLLDNRDYRQAGKQMKAKTKEKKLYC